MTFQRYVALGDSFTEGVGDPDPSRPNGWRGWADRFAEALAGSAGPDFGYANLAIRGRKLPAIIDEQLEPALALKPDLVTIHGGANDVLRPKVDLDALATRYDDAVARLTASGAKVVMFTVADPGPNPVMSMMRGRMAIFNEAVREIADRHGTTLVDMWRMRGWTVAEIMDVDRLHLNPVGHQMIAIAVLDTLELAARPEAAAAHRLCRSGRGCNNVVTTWTGRVPTSPRGSGDVSPDVHPVTASRRSVQPSRRSTETTLVG